jgi:positive control factor
MLNEKEINTMLDLLKEYRQSLQDLQELLSRRVIEGAADNELSLIRGMISSMEFSIAWLKDGHNPDHTRGVEKKAVYHDKGKRGIQRRAKYQREFIVNPDMYQWTADKQEEEVTENKKAIEAVENLTWDLSKREKEIYILHKGIGFTKEEIAEMLNLKYSTINNTYARASAKVLKKLQQKEVFFAN